jgi:hypothetical protein
LTFTDWFKFSLIEELTHEIDVWFQEEFLTHRISIPLRYRTTMMTVRRFQKWNVTNVIYIQNDACSLPQRGNKWFYFKYLLTGQQMVFHLFFALTVSIRSWVLFPTVCGSINTKSMFWPMMHLAWLEAPPLGLNYLVGSLF